MTYTSETDLLREFPTSDLAVLTGDPSGLIINIDRVMMAAEMAQNEIDANLSVLYNLPFHSVPSVITHISYELTVYFVYSMYYNYSEIPDQIKWRRINAMSLLKLIKKGELILTGELQKNRIESGNITSEREFSLLATSDFW